MSTGNRRIALAALLLLVLPLVGAKCPNGSGGGGEPAAEIITEQGWVPTPAGPRWSAYELYEDFILVHGDMRFELDEIRAFQADLPEENVEVIPFNAVAAENLWSDGRVPYDAGSITESFPGLCQGSTTETCETHLDCSSQGPRLCMQSSGAAKIQWAIDHWNNQTDFQFVPATSADLHVLEFHDLDSTPCYSNAVGYTNWRPDLPSSQGVWIAPGCTRGTVVHEIGHAIGFYHEHLHSSRDLFVEIRTDALLQERCVSTGCFQYISDSDEHNYTDKWGTPWGEYNYGSIMHYGPMKREYGPPPRSSLPTVVPLMPMPSWTADTTTVAGQRDGLSKGDIAAANALVAKSRGEPMPDDTRALFERRGTFPIVPEEVQTADIDGDGTLELIGLMKGQGSAAEDGDLVVGWLQPDGTFDFEVQGGGHCVGQNKSCVFGDVDGDGADDLVELDDLTDRLKVSLSVNDGFAGPAIWQTVPETAGTSPSELWLADVDGDCDDDAVIIRHDDNQAEQVWVAESTGHGFEAALRFESATLQGQLEITQLIGIDDMDFDGDADLVVADRFGDVWVHRSDGTAFVEGELRAEGACHTDFGAVCTLQDMNDSNYPDLVVMGWTNSHWEPWGLADHPLRRLRLFMNDGFSFSGDPDGRFNVPCLDGTLDAAGNQINNRPAGCVAVYHEMDCLAGDGCLFADVNGDFEPDVIEPFGHDGGTGGDGVYVSINTNAGNNWNPWTDGNVPAPENRVMCTPQAPEEPDSAWIEAGTLSFEKVVDGGYDGVFAVAATGDLYEFEGGTSWRLVAGDHRDYFGGEQLTAVAPDGQVSTYYDEYYGEPVEGWFDLWVGSLDSNLVLSGPSGIFATRGTSGELYKYTSCGSTICWSQISDRRWVYAVGGRILASGDDSSPGRQALYSMNSSGVWSWNEYTDTWSVIGPHAGGIWAGGNTLYAQNHASGFVYSYNPHSDNTYGGAEAWTPIGAYSPASFAISLDGETLVMLTSGHRVRLYSGSPNVWIDLQDPRSVDKVFVAGNKVWSRDANNGRLRYLPLD